MSGRPSTSTPTRPVAIKGTRLPRDAALREEQVDEYAPGGYRQIHVGDVLNCGRYRVVRKLGFGHFSTVWLVRDQRRNKHVALKVVKSAFKYAQTAIDEVALLRIIQSPDRGGLNHPGRRHIVEFLDCFALHPTRGPDALLSLDRDDPTPRHVCMTFEPLGENLLTLMKRLATCDATNLKIGVPTALVQQIIRQVLQALAYLHDHCGLIHTDLKLENIIVQVEDVEELVEACEVEEGALGVSPTNATRTVPFKEPVTSQSPTVSTPGGAGGVLGALGRERSGSTRINGLAALSSSPREITITGSAPLPSPLHPWGRVNTGPEVNNLALIMAQVKLQRRLTEESLRANDQRRSASSDASSQTDSFALTESPPSFDLSSSPAEMHQPPPQSKSHPLPNISRLHPPSHTPSQTLHHRRTWAAPPPANSQNLGSTSSSYNSNTSSATLFSMTHSQGEMSASTSTMSSAPTSLENSLVLSAVVDGVRTMKIQDESAEKKTSGSSSRPQQYDWTSTAAFEADVPAREGSGGMMAPFSFDLDPTEESVAPSAVPLGMSGPRLRNDLDLMLASSSMDFPSSPPVFGPAARTPTATPTPHQPMPTATSLLTARKPKTIDAASAAAMKLPTPDEGSGDSTPTLISDHSVSASPFSASSLPPQRGRSTFGKPHPNTSSSSRPRPPPRIHVKIADLGNATPIAKHFTPDIQTRPYRAPEVILGHKNWDQSVDIWSVGCILFELLTSDLLFFAEEDKKGNRYSRDDDHLAQIIELMGDLPWARKWGGRYSKDFFNQQGGLRRISKMRPWSIRAVLSQKYDYPPAQAEKLRAFLLPMLALDPAQRPSAAELAQHPWLDDEDAAPPYALDRVSAEDEFYRVNDAKLAGVLQALEDVEGKLGEA